MSNPCFDRMKTTRDAEIQLLVCDFAAKLHVEPWHLLKLLVEWEDAFAYDDGPAARLEMLKTFREVVKGHDLSIH